MVRSGDRLAPAIPGSGGGGGPDEPQPVWNPAAAQVVPTGAGAPCWPPASVAAMPIEFAGSLVAGWLGGVVLDETRGDPGSPGPLALTATFWPAADGLELASGSTACGPAAGGLACAAVDAPAEPTAVTREPDPAALPADAGPGAFPPAALPVAPLQDAPAVADPLTGAEPPHVVVVVVVVVVDDAGSGVVMTGVAGGGVVVVVVVVVVEVVLVVVDPAGGVVVAVVEVVGAVVDPAGEMVVVGGGVVVVVVVVVVDATAAGAGVDVDVPLAAAPADCSPLSADATEHGRANRAQTAAEAPSTAIDDLRLIRASPIPERDACRLHPAVSGRVHGHELQNEPGAAEPDKSARRQA
jgi:hypothetical protein